MQEGRSAGIRSQLVGSEHVTDGWKTISCLNCWLVVDMPWCEAGLTGCLPISRMRVIAASEGLVERC